MTRANNIFNRSILLHELVHHLQAASGRFDMGSGAFVRRNAGVWVFRACVERTGHNATRHLKLGVGAACMPNAGPSVSGVAFDVRRRSARRS